MKLSTFIILFSCSKFLFAQTTPDWQAHFVIEKPWNGQRDTIIIGCDYDATEGFDAAFDSINTDFNFPLSVRSNDLLVQSELGSCAANMKTNIKGFDTEVSFDVFVISDTFGLGSYEAPLIIWDTAEIYFLDDTYRLSRVNVIGDHSYIGAFDSEDEWIMNYYLETYYYYWDEYDFRFGLYFEENPDEYYFDCPVSESVAKFTIRLTFSLLTDIESLQTQDQYFQYSPFTQTIQVSKNIKDHTTTTLYNMNGKIVLRSDKKLIQINSLPDGFYVINLNTETLNISQTIIKL